MASLSDSDDSVDLSSEWTEVDASPKGGEAKRSEVTKNKIVVAEDVDIVKARLEKLELIGPTSESAGVQDGTATTTGQQLVLLAKEIGAIQIAVLDGNLSTSKRW